MKNLNTAIIISLLLFSCSGDDDDVTISVDNVDTTINIGQMCYNVNETEICTYSANALKQPSNQLLVYTPHVSIKVFNQLGQADINSMNTKLYVSVDYFEGRTTHVLMESGFVSLDSLVANRIFGHFESTGYYWEREGIHTLDTTIVFKGEFNGLIVE